MTDNTLLKEFVDFVNSVNPDTKIDQSNGWKNCAVGKFYDFKFSGSGRNVNCLEISKFSGKIFGVEDIYNYNFRSPLGEVYYNLAHYRHGTYGDLAVELKEAIGEGE